MNNASASLLPTNLELIATLIENEKCALVLGPQAHTVLLPDGKTVPTDAFLAAQLAEEYYQNYGHRIAEPENLGLVCTSIMSQAGVSRTKLEIKVRDFYRQIPEPSPLMREVAKLPFKLIFTTSPDLLLQKAFVQEQKRSYKDGYYRFSRTQVDDFDDTPEGWTYIYQLFGRATDKLDSSIPLTLADQLTYIDSVQGVGVETQLPKGLAKAMLECEAFLFLGFDYENWYLKVLFHILRVSQKAKFLFGIPEGLSTTMPIGTEAFFKEHYRFSFLSEQALDLLSGIQAQLNKAGSGHAAANTATKKLLYLYAPEDEAFKNRLDKHLTAVKKAHELETIGMDDFRGGDKAQLENNAVNTASVIIPILSADFLADEKLWNILLNRVLARQSKEVLVVAVFARQVMGPADLLKGKAHVFLSEDIVLNKKVEEIGLPDAARFIESLIALMP